MTTTGWQPIKTAPVGQNVLLYVSRPPLSTMYIGKWRESLRSDPCQSDGYEWRQDGSGRYANPTHWMPLSEPPKEQS